MKNIKFALWGFLIIVSGLWLMANTFPESFTYFEFRYLANQYSGSIAMGSMSLCMLLAVRPKWLEPWLHGLDKGYRLHKWLGITALVSALTHFGLTKGTKWMVGWGWLERPNRPQKPAEALNAPFNLEHWLGSFKGIAETVGEWTFYLALVLLCMALIKRIPYHWFKKFHKWLAVAYLGLVFHAVILIKFDYWSQPIGWLLAILLVAGTISALIVLFKRVGVAQKSIGTVTEIQSLPECDSVELFIDVPNWQGHQAGQFAFIRNLRGNQEIHPFTIASFTANSLRFLIKNLGDYTAETTRHFRVDDKVEIEGPYGYFTFKDNVSTQVWVGSGIGITPFIARLEQLAQRENQQKVFLFYCYRNTDERFIHELQQKSAQANVQLILWHSATQGRLMASDIRQKTGDLTNASLWFSGNSQFGEQLKSDLHMVQFHQELFEMR
ncbi:ferric reductase-like transmembrane domain-containing protein [Glaesserella sp.]|uniref:ferredoxin reductase family protein n=1 Tax=Glaesserella sp. TaxID=2094731 RepID=UPI0035A082BD